jgi:tetratricopeptide (TPR) repeat protein
MEELKLAELAPVNTPEYRRELARVVEEHDRLKNGDKHVLQLKLQLANSYRDAKDYKEANRWLTQLVGRLDTPNENGIILEMLAANHERLGDREKAIELWQEILSRYPNSSAGATAQAALESMGKNNNQR